MRLRSIDEEAVAEVIEKPEQEFDDLEHHAHVTIRANGNRHLIVVYTRRGDATTVITVYSTSKLNKLIATKERRGAWQRTK